MATLPRVNKVLASAVARLLRPLVRVLLAHGMAFDAFVELAKHAYVEVAMQEFGIPGRKQTVSRVSVLTGLTRKEVQRVLQGDAVAETDTGERYNRAARVIAGWVRDPKFRKANGEAQVLPFEGARSFSALVRRYSGDMPPRAVLDELLRVGAVERVGDERLRLKTRAYVPGTSAPDKIAILGTDVADLICTINHNLANASAAPHFQRKVMYDNLPREAVEKFRALSAAQAQQLLERLDSWLAQHDRDANPEVKGTERVRAGIGIYYFEENLREAPEEK